MLIYQYKWRLLQFYLYDNTKTWAGKVSLVIGNSKVIPFISNNSFNLSCVIETPWFNNNLLILLDVIVLLLLTIIGGGVMTLR